MMTDGLIWAFAGQIYECIEIKSHVRLDGTLTSLAVIGSACADCGLPFLTSSPAGNDPHTAPLSRRCIDHRRPGVRVGGPVAGWGDEARSARVGG